MLCYVYRDTFYEDKWDALNAVYENSLTLEDSIGHKICIYDTRRINYNHFIQRRDVVNDINNIMDKFTCFLYEDVGECNYNQLTNTGFDSNQIRIAFAEAIRSIVDPTNYFIMPSNEIHSFLTTENDMKIFYDN